MVLPGWCLVHPLSVRSQAKIPSQEAQQGHITALADDNTPDMTGLAPLWNNTERENERMKDWKKKGGKLYDTLLVSWLSKTPFNSRKLQMHAWRDQSFTWLACYAALAALSCKVKDFFFGRYVSQNSCLTIVEPFNRIQFEFTANIFMNYQESLTALRVGNQAPKLIVDPEKDTFPLFNHFLSYLASQSLRMTHLVGECSADTRRVVSLPLECWSGGWISCYLLCWDSSVSCGCLAIGV